MLEANARTVDDWLCVGKVPDNRYSEVFQLDEVVALALWQLNRTTDFIPGLAERRRLVGSYRVELPDVVTQQFSNETIYRPVNSQYVFFSGDVVVEHLLVQHGLNDTGAKTSREAHLRDHSVEKSQRMHVVRHNHEHDGMLKKEEAA